MRAPTVSLCTFTYNDGPLADGLLRHLDAWTRRPGEIVVTDDGSNPPYAPASPPDNLRLLRLPENLGITKAKHRGISSATGEIILAVDCDVRLCPDWLDICLPHALNPGIGAVCGPVEHAPANDAVGRFMRAFGDNHHQNADGPVDFIPGNAYLIRRQVWERVGGFGDYSRNVCEDHHLSTKIKNAGLALYCDSRAKAVQTRRISRLAMVKRFWKWCHKPVKDQLPPRRYFPGFLAFTFAEPMIARLTGAAEAGEPVFVYFDLLYLSHVVYDLIDTGARTRTYDPALARAYQAGLARITAGRPKLAALLRHDLAALGHRPSALTAADTSDPFGDIFDIFESLAPTGVYDWLEREGVSAILADERARSDFSFYESQSAEDGETA